MAKRDYHIPVYGSQGCHPSDAQGVPGELPKVSPLVHFYQEVVVNFSTSDWKVKLKQEIWKEILGFTMISFWSGAKRFFLPKIYEGSEAISWRSSICPLSWLPGALWLHWKHLEEIKHLEGTPLKINMEPQKKHHWKGKSSSKAPFLGSMVYSSSISLRNKKFRNSFDMRLMKNNIALLYPDAIFLCSQSNEDLTGVNTASRRHVFLNPSCSANGLGCWFGARWFWDSQGALKQ